MGERVIRKEPMVIGAKKKSTAQSLLPESTPKYDSFSSQCKDKMVEDELQDLLRYILIGKVVHEAAQGRPHEPNLNLSLQMYLNSTIGRVEMASDREVEFIHAILAMQSFSSFLRVLKRLLNIPGITRFPDRIQTIYFECWRWLLQNDALQYNHRIIHPSTHKCPYHVHNVTTSAEQILMCIDAIGSKYGNSFPNTITANMKDLVSSHYSHHQLLDVDDALEHILKYTEQHHLKLQMLYSSIFYEEIGKRRVVQSRSLIHNLTCETQALSIDELVDLLHLYIFYDTKRTGNLSYDSFREQTLTWSTQTSVSIPDMTELITKFAKGSAAINYIHFIAFFYTFYVEESRYPVTTDLDTHRGIERHLVEMIKEYVQSVCVKVPQKYMPSKTEIINLKRSLMKLRYQLKGSNRFLSKWIASALCNRINTVQTIPISISKPKARKTKRQKAWLHIVEAFNGSCNH